MRKLLSNAISVGIIASTSLIPAAYADVSAGALPVFNHGDKVEVTKTGSNMNIKIDPANQAQHAVGTAYWDSFNIGKDARVNVEFTAHNQTSLNYVDAAGGMSQIYGQFTNSGCNGCGYAGTGKVVLINPNGVLFGDGANVNLNSFTASTMKAVYDDTNKTLKLTRDANSKNGIIVQDGARIHGDKNVAFASDNITVYKGSKITTNTENNVGNTAYGKVKLVTSDGVNFSYYNNGAIDQVTDVKTSADKMTLYIAGNIVSGNIDARNASTHTNSEINTNEAVLRAYKAERGNDGNIWLTANNRVITENTTLRTENNTGAESRTGGNIVVTAGNKATLNKDAVNAVGDVSVSSLNHDVNVDDSSINTPKDVSITAGKIASIQNGSIVKGNNITVKGTTRGQIVNSEAKADKDVNVISTNDLAWTNNAILKAGKDINITSENGSLLLTNSQNTADGKINLTSKGTISSERIGSSTFNAGDDINVTSTGESIILTGTEPFKSYDELNLKAAKNVEIKRDSSLTVKNVNLDAGKDIHLASTDGTVTVQDTTNFVNAEKIYINGGQDVKTTGTLNANDLSLDIQAGRDVDVNLKNIGNSEKGLVAKAGRDMTVTTPGTLSVSYLYSEKDMTINANKVIKGKDYMPDPTVGGFTDTSSRGYIEVKGEFNSNVATDNYTESPIVSKDKTADKKYYQRHHIQYGDEKIYLVTKLPAEEEPTDPTIAPTDPGRDTDVVDPTAVPTTPSVTPTVEPTVYPTIDPTEEPTTEPTTQPTTEPTVEPTSCDGNPAASDTTRDESAPTI